MGIASLQLRAGIVSMCNDKKEGGRVFSDDHHRNDLDKTDTKNSTDKPPS